MFPTPTPDDAGDASFLGPSRDPNQKADMGSRARARQRPQKQQPKKYSPQASPETQKQQNTVHSSVLSAKAKRTEQQPFLTVFTAFCRARAQHRRHARQRAKMGLAYIPPIPSKKSVLFGFRGFLEGSLDDADQAPLKHHPGPTPDPDDVSHIGLNPAYTRCFARVSHRQAKPQARAGDAEVPDLGHASRPSDEGRRRQGAAPIAKASRLIA